jgi:DNA-binding response OmpR family regulator
MRALVADDDRVGAAVLARSLERWGLEVVVVHDGDAAWKSIERDPSLSLAVLDWMMPGLEGPTLCARIRAQAAHAHLYVLLVTGRETRADIIAGLDAGANDYIVKPFDQEELRARVQVGIRMIELRENLNARVVELQNALSQIKQLSGLLPICSYCKRIRSDENYWEQVDSYIAHHSNATFSHGICPHCYDAVLASFDLEPQAVKGRASVSDGEPRAVTTGRQTND